MNTRMHRFLILSAISCLWLSGCTSTYPRENIEQSIKDICKKEFDLTVLTHVDGLTVFAYLSLNDFPEDIERIETELLENLSNVMSSLSRVVLSSDGPFQFIVLHAIAPSETGISLTLIRYVDDIRRLLTGDISHGEFFNRLVIKKGADPQATLEYLLFSSFKMLPFPGTRQSHPYRIIPLPFFEGSTQKIFDPIDLRTIKKSDGTYLVYCRLRETHLPPSLKAVHTLPSLYGVSYGTYLFEVNDSFTALTRPVMPVSSIDNDGTIISNNTLFTISKYGTFETWKTHLPCREIILADFLADQISKRIKDTIATDVRWTKIYLTNNVFGTFVPLDDELPPLADTAPSGKTPAWLTRNIFYRALVKGVDMLSAFARRIIPSSERFNPVHRYGFFRFTIDVQDRILYLIQKQIQPAIGVKNRDLLEDVNEKIVKKVLNRYGFLNYREVQLINTNTGRTLTVAR